MFLHYDVLFLCSQWYKSEKMKYEVHQDTNHHNNTDGKNKSHTVANGK